MADVHDLSGKSPSLSGDVDQSAHLRQLLRAYDMNHALTESFWSQTQSLRSSRFYPLLMIVVRVAKIVKRRRQAHLAKKRAASGSSPTAVVSSDSATVTAPPSLRRLLGDIKSAVVVALRGYRAADPRHVPATTPYGEWFEMYNTPLPHIQGVIDRRLGLLRSTPTISVVMALYNSDETYLTAALDSLIAQTYPHFTVVMVDDGSPSDVGRRIAAQYAARDGRFTLIAREKNGGISAATNDAIAAATGEWIAFMDHDDLLVSNALALMAMAIDDHPSWQIIYSDEDLANEHGALSVPYFKSDFDPLLLLGQNYMAHLVLTRRELVNELGGLRSDYDGAQDWDFVLRATEKVGRAGVGHVPYILYHWRSHPQSTRQNADAKPYASSAGHRAVIDALSRRGVAAQVEAVGVVGWQHVHFELPAAAPRVSILVPTRDGSLLSTCVNSVLERTTYDNYEIVIIDNGSTSADTATYLASLPERVRVIRDDSPFNYSALHNRAVPSCTGDVLVLLNDDTEVINPHWLREMVAMVMQPGVGVVGAKLLYPTHAIQHAGVVLGFGGVADHVGKLAPADSSGYFGRIALPCEYSAVTAACLAIRTSVWNEVGGLDEGFQVAWNDIDLCLRVRELGLAVAYSPDAQLFHYESLTRGNDFDPVRFGRYSAEVERMRQRWFATMMSDPYYNPNLSVSTGLYELAHPPRVSLAFHGLE